MTISLSEQLESDIKAYLHKTFGTYFSSLDERFAADIKEDVINASDFHHGYYNDDDISIAFQRVTLGRMGHPDWQIYHSCTDTEVNTMKQNVKVNTPIHIRPAFIRNSRRLPTRSWVRSAMCGWTSDLPEKDSTIPGGPITATGSTPTNSKVSFRRSWMPSGQLARSRIWRR